MITPAFRSTIFDKFALMVWGSIGGVTLIICLLAFSQWSILRTGQKRLKADLAEINSLFEKAISDGTVQGTKEREFMIRQFRGRIFFVSFTNSVGELGEVVVAPSLDKHNLWKFHQVTPIASEQEFYRNMANTK
ncbi:MAG: hypothetical protein ACOYM3_20730 [Terrimicrobiaceae bacterium]